MGIDIIKDGVLYGGEITSGRINRNAEFSEQTHENLFLKLSSTYTAAAWSVTPSLSWSEANSDLEVFEAQQCGGGVMDTHRLASWYL